MSKRPGRPRISGKSARPSRSGDQGFTLVELLIVTTVLPLIIGALSVGLISVFSLQSGVSSRLSNTTDAQVVAADYETDVQGTSQITTASSSTPQCTSPTVTGTQLLGLWSNVNQTGQLIISYVSVTTGSGSTATYSLERLLCSGNGANEFTASNITTLSSNLPVSQAPPTVTCVANVPNLCSKYLGRPTVDLQPERRPSLDDDR